MPQIKNHARTLALSEKDIPFRQMAETLKLLGNANRLMILSILADSPQSVTAIHQLINESTKLSQSSLSQHLALLRAYKIVNFKKHGQRATYYISNDRIIELLKALKAFNSSQE